MCRPALPTNCGNWSPNMSAGSGGLLFAICGAVIAGRLRSRPPKTRPRPNRQRCLAANPKPPVEPILPVFAGFRQILTTHLLASALWGIHLLAGGVLPYLHNASLRSTFRPEARVSNVVYPG